MQVAVGHQIVDGKIVPSDWKAIIAGPVSLVRWPHMLLAALITTSMCVIATGAWYQLRAIHRHEARAMMHWGMGLAAVLVPVQLLFGHLNGKYVVHHHPSKIAAIEARWHDEKRLPRCS
jgi:cytochrome d ubiquinol oxidase subunit I